MGIRWFGCWLGFVVVCSFQSCWVVDDCCFIGRVVMSQLDLGWGLFLFTEAVGHLAEEGFWEFFLVVES